jgi:hypothetical protein
MSKQELTLTAMAKGLTSYLQRKYGAVMTAGNFAEQLQTSLTGLRIARHRGRDLPPPAPLPGRGCRWLSTDVALWFAARSMTAAEPGDDGHPGARARHSPRRRGRPRKLASATDGGAQ